MYFEHLLYFLASGLTGKTDDIIFRSGRISSVYIVNKWVVVTLLSKLVNFECVGMLECWCAVVLECVGVLVCWCVGVLVPLVPWMPWRLEECKIGRV